MVIVIDLPSGMGLRCLWVHTTKGYFRAVTAFLLWNLNFYSGLQYWRLLQLVCGVSLAVNLLAGLRKKRTWQIFIQLGSGGKTWAMKNPLYFGADPLSIAKTKQFLLIAFGGGQLSLSARRSDTGSTWLIFKKLGGGGKSRYILWRVHFKYKKWRR